MKPKVLFINSVCGFGSTGRIVSDLAKSSDYDSLVCFGRKKDFANVNSYRFANFFDNAFAAIRTILFNDNLDLCKNSTKKLINKIKEFNPDVIHLHNLHGYYINIDMLFKFLKEYNKPVVWTLHDTWALTGYCPILDYFNCDQYQTECKNCKANFSYPFSLFKQNVKKQYYRKKELFTGINNLTIVTPSNWLAGLAKQSFLKDKNIKVIHNGIDLSDFKPSLDKNDKFTAIAVAGTWTVDRGIDELNKVITLLDKDIDVIAVGKNSNKINAKSISYTNSKQELVDLYSSSHVLLMPTLTDNFPTVNIESLACGTPVITYNTGGSPEIPDNNTGIVVKQSDYKEMANIINKLKENYTFDKNTCVNRSKEFSSEKMINSYKELFKELAK